MTIAKILTYVSILISGFFAAINLSEYYLVGIMKDVEGYPFGGEGPVPYYYKTAQLYAMVNLTYGLLFTLLALMGILNIRKKYISGHLLFAIVFLLIIIMLFHSLSD